MDMSQPSSSMGDDQGPGQGQSESLATFSAVGHVNLQFITHSFYPFMGRKRQGRNSHTTMPMTTTSESSKLSMQNTELIIDKLKNEQHRRSTKKSYRSVWKNFNRFLIRLDVKLTSWEHRLILFVGHLIHSNKQSSTVKSYISAIKAVLAMNNIDLDPDC